MNMPQEIEVWYTIPAIRKELAISLKELKLNQKEIAKKLSITESAVSQYFNEKRAVNIELNDKIKSEIRKSADKIVNKGNLMHELLRICDLIRSERILCKHHKMHDKDIPNNCDICLSYNYSLRA